jgi:hypothetical protein
MPYFFLNLTLKEYFMAAASSASTAVVASATPVLDKEDQKEGSLETPSSTVVVKIVDPKKSDLFSLNNDFQTILSQLKITLVEAECRLQCLQTRVATTSITLIDQVQPSITSAFLRQLHEVNISATLNKQLKTAIEILRLFKNKLETAI